MDCLWLYRKHALLAPASVGARDTLLSVPKTDFQSLTTGSTSPRQRCATLTTPSYTSVLTTDTAVKQNSSCISISFGCNCFTIVIHLSGQRPTTTCRTGNLIVNAKTTVLVPNFALHGLCRRYRGHILRRYGAYRTVKFSTNDACCGPLPQSTFIDWCITLRWHYCQDYLSYFSHSCIAISTALSNRRVRDFQLEHCMMISGGLA